MKHYYNYYNKNKYIKKYIIDDSNINYFENYEDLNYKYEIYAATLGRQRLLKDLFDQNQTKFPFQR